MSLLKILNYRQLLIEFTKREIKQRYKQSILGYAWVILNPFFTMLVMAFVFSKIMRVQDLGVPYTLYLYAGLLPWTLFANSLGSSVNSLVSNASLIKKIYFPREVFVISTILAKLIDYFLASSIFILFMIFYQIPITYHIIWFIPILLIQLLFTYGLSLILSAFNLFYRDIQYLLNLIIMMWMYLTPVIYPSEIFPEKYRFIFQINPMAVLINAYRQVILAHDHPKLSSILIALLLAVFMAIIGKIVFKKLEGRFADVV